MSKKKHQRIFWLTEEDIKRLENLSDRLNIPPRKVVCAALKLYEDGLNALDDLNGEE